MDPLSQGVFGALWASQAAPKNELRKALVLGGLAGLAADLDVLISSPGDPMFGLEFHRHFTHALAFIPVGALICAIVLKPFFKTLSFKRAYLYAFLGFASHGLLDSFTSYGTQLLWPFSNMRVAWDSIAIIDPLFTLPLLALLIAAALRYKNTMTRVALGWAVLYLSLGFVQRERAIAEVTKLATSRGHTPTRVSAKPSIGNMWLFRGIYEAKGRYWVDAIRVPVLGTNRVYEGNSLAAFDLGTLTIDPDSRLAYDIKRFNWFSDSYLSRIPELESHPDEYLLSDFRYSLLPNSVSPLWGIRFRHTEPDKHVSFDSFRNVGDAEQSALWAMLMGRDLPRD